VTSAPTRWIRTADQLGSLADQLSGSRAIGFDIEADSLHHYTEKVCLLQVTAFGGDAWLVDTIALRDLSPLAPVFADASILKVVHGGDNDVTSMRRDFGVTFRTMFDTSIAARLLGDTELGLQALVRNEVGVELTKGSQKDDWSKRPLTPKQEAYALADVAHLMQLAARLTERLAATGRTEWAREEFAALANLQAGAKRSGPDEFRRIKGSAKLSRRQQGVLRELHVWREERAAAADRPPFRIVAPDVLIAIAERSPTTIDEVEEMLASHPRQVPESDVILTAIERGLNLPESELPARPVGERTNHSAAVHRRAEALRTWRDTQAKSLKLDPSVVLSQRLIERLSLGAPRTLDELAEIEGIRQWRVTDWGAALLAACA